MSMQPSLLPRLSHNTSGRQLATPHCSQCGQGIKSAEPRMACQVPHLLVRAGEHAECAEGTSHIGLQACCPV